jgi:hypothetical protein
MEILFGLNPVLLVLGAIAAGLGSFFMYRGTTPALSVGKRALLGTLRFLSLFIIILLLCEPILARLTTITENPILAVLIDTSESMRIGDEDEDTAAPKQQIRTLLGALGEWAPSTLRYFAFDSRVSNLVADEPSLDSLVFEGQRTDISAAIEHVRSELSESNLGAVLLVSDGRYTSGRNPRHTADRSDVPIYTVVLGDSTEKRDIRISRVNTNDITYTGVGLPFEVAIVATGFAGSRVVVSVSVGDSTVGSSRIDVPPDGTEASVSMVFTPETPGLKQFIVSVTGLEGEATFRNNVSTTNVRVLDRRRRILLVGGGPDPDLAAMRQILESDESNEVSTIVQKRGDGYYGSGMPGTFGDIDVIVLAGFPAPTANVDDVRRVATAIESGTPGIFIASRHMDLRRFEEILSPVFGTTVPRRQRTFYEATPVPTPSGRRHPVLEGIAEGDAWLRLPPVTTTDAPWSVAADARVLATARVRDVNLKDPLLAVRSQAGTRTAVFFGAGTWRMANLPEALSPYQDHWPGLLRNLIQWVSAAEDDRMVRVRTTSAEFAGGDRIGFSGQVYDESMNPVSDADIGILVTAPTGDEYRYSMESIGNGRYVMDASPLGEGAYRYRATALRAGSPVGTDAGSFAVGNLTLEFRNPVADPLLMRQIALRSGGAALTPGTFSRFPALVASSGRFEPVVSERRRELELWRQPAFLLIVILSLAVEWVLRKRAGLS